MQRCLFYILPVGLLVLAAVALQQEEQATAFDKGKASLPAEVAAVLQAHCYICHGPDKQKGGIRLDELDPDFINGIHAEDWHDVLNAINLGQMPPKGQPVLPDQGRRALTGWITKELKHAKEARKGAGNQAVMRRLTRYEYNNTMADLLGIEWDYAASLPPDSKSSDGFENNGQSLGISPIQMEYYLKAARQGLAKAVVQGDQPVIVEQVITKSQGPARRSTYTNHENGRVMPGQAFIGKTLEFPREGVVRIKVLVDDINVPDGQGYPQMLLRVGHRADTISPESPFAVGDVLPNPDGGPVELQFTGRIESMPLPGHNPKFPGILITVANAYDPGPDYKTLKKKHSDAQRRLIQYEKAKAKAKKQGKPAPEPPKVELVELPEMPSFTVKTITFEGPVLDAWPPAHHRQILFDRSDGMSESAYAKAVLERFISRAYRRPATDSDIEKIYDFYLTIRPKMPSFESAIREALAMVLISPEFLYIVEKRTTGKDASQEVRLSDHELAARLSYFLWSTTPDQILREAADRTELSSTAELEKQVRRMISDERIHALVQHFTSQWLDLSGVDRVAVNPQYYPHFDDTLKQDMKQETIHFFGELLRSDLSALNLIDSDFVVVNRPLAMHYGLPAPKGRTFERVDLEGHTRRGGLLTQASVMLMNSNGEDSHPIRRAVWLRDRLLDDPPAPPPPDVPDLDETNPETAGLSLKKQLELHREKPACADCHIGIDPWGIPFENFDAVGLWRDQVTRHVGKKVNTSPVVSDSVLPTGHELSDINDLKRVLKTDLKDRFARSLVRYMLAYSLGRSIDYRDSDTVDGLLIKFKESGYQLDELIIATVKCEAFNTK
ncbi:MAG: DUF1592 domain-containing protein [Phycisphaeraceae bacterium]